MNYQIFEKLTTSGLQVSVIYLLNPHKWFDIDIREFRNVVTHEVRRLGMGRIC